MQALKDRRTLLVVVGAALALVAGLVLAKTLMNRHRGEANVAPPAAQAGLVVETGSNDDGKLNPTARLRCFVAGQFVGEATLAECAKKNGVATGALDVGVDESGALAAANQAGAMLVPLPPPNEAATATAAPGVAPAPGAAAAPASATLNSPAGGCWRYAGGEWRKLPAEMTLGACVQTLFAGRCERQGGATYGRWMAQTLRLVPGKVEVASDNRTFHMLAEQSASCVIAPVE